MIPTVGEAIDRCELDAVIIRDPSSVTECVLYPPDATDDELETMWILAEEGDYTPLAESR